MATAIARLGDQLSHGGNITSASPNWNCNGIAIARVTDTALCAIHGAVTITSGSPDWKANGLAMARIGSTCSCGATITTGSPTWNVS
jgi:uncharacterized Zn-binding protein involved in type VI secretion